MEFEIIWVSHDRTSDDFVQYYQQMPWLALAADRVVTEGSQLSRLFGVQGIPSLVLLDVSRPDSGHFPLLSADGVARVTQDPHALQFPYRPRLSVLKALVPRTLRSYVQRKKEYCVASVKSTLNNILVKASPANIVKLILKLLRNSLNALLSLLFPNLNLVKTNNDFEL